MLFAQSGWWLPSQPGLPQAQPMLSCWCRSHGVDSDIIAILSSISLLWVASGLHYDMFVLFIGRCIPIGVAGTDRTEWNALSCSPFGSTLKDTYSLSASPWLNAMTLQLATALKMQ
eukprot:3805740-Amphidinium_carterae.1